MKFDIDVIKNFEIEILSTSIYNLLTPVSDLKYSGEELILCFEQNSLNFCTRMKVKVFKYLPQNVDLRWLRKGKRNEKEKKVDDSNVTGNNEVSFLCWSERRRKSWGTFFLYRAEWSSRFYSSNFGVYIFLDKLWKVIVVRSELLLSATAPTKLSPSATSIFLSLSMTYESIFACYCDLISIKKWRWNKNKVKQKKEPNDFLLHRKSVKYSCLARAERFVFGAVICSHICQCCSNKN